MGIKLFSCCNSQRCEGPIQPPDPNPCNFSILYTYESLLVDLCIVMAKYHGCTTFDGKKLMLVKGRKKEIEKMTMLDPHLLGNGHVVVARFEPNDEGIEMIVALLKLMEESAS
jgi:hypothetical protein